MSSPTWELKGFVGEVLFTDRNARESHTFLYWAEEDRMPMGFSRFRTSIDGFEICAGVRLQCPDVETVPVRAPVNPLFVADAEFCWFEKAFSEFGGVPVVRGDEGNGAG